MKFGRHLELYKIPEWMEFYIDYDKLKNMLDIIKK
jgi:SPX domain protein involved in polyphosphate accumulation